MQLFYEYSETVVEEVALHVLQVENMGNVTETLPRRLTSFAVSWMDYVYWEVTTEQELNIRLRGSFPSHCAFDFSVSAGIPGTSSILRTATVARSMDIPARTKTEICVVGDQQSDHASVYGDVTGTVSSLRVINLRIKLVVLTFDGDHVKTEYLDQ
ncbi:hypothetical protein [Streptomyces sp. NPDC020480]|uniref:hypothetical protein n=1 Tax=Streptomyces sp. NPDC020480 TaxID=3365076 RepID=UPI0037BCE45A